METSFLIQTNDLLKQQEESKKISDELMSRVEKLKAEKEIKEAEEAKLKIKLMSYESLEQKIDRELEALLIKKLNNNEPFPVKDLYKI